MFTSQITIWRDIQSIKSSFYLSLNKIDFSNIVSDLLLINNSEENIFLEDSEKKDIESLINIMNEQIYIYWGKYEDSDYLSKKEILSIMKRIPKNKKFNRYYQKKETSTFKTITINVGIKVIYNDTYKK